MMTHETMLKCIRFDLEHLKVARGSDYSGVEALEMALDILDPKPTWKANFRYGMRGEKMWICSKCDEQSMERGRYCLWCGVEMGNPIGSESEA